jgi:small-conductance mechanosensitive channel
MFQFSLLEIGNWVDADQSTGRVVHVPNGRIMTSPLYNFGGGFDYIWNEIPVLVTFESDWKKAKEILLKTVTEQASDISERVARQVRESSKRFLIFQHTFTPTVYTSVQDSGVLLTIRYMCRPRDRRGTTESIWEDILREFSATPEIDFAYPTRRFYDRAAEAKDSSGVERSAPGATEASEPGAAEAAGSPEAGSRER